MAPGALDPLTKELIYLAVSVSNGCAYCTASHGAAAKRLGMTPEMLGELLAVVGMANETNRSGRRVSGSGRRAVRKPVLMRPHVWRHCHTPPTQTTAPPVRSVRVAPEKILEIRRTTCALFDREAETLGNVTMLEHVNVEIPDQALASNFYLVGCGFTRDPYLFPGTNNMWVNIGKSQFHLPTGDALVLRGHIGIVTPSREQLLDRFAGVKKKLADSKFRLRSTTTTSRRPVRGATSSASTNRTRNASAKSISASPMSSSRCRRGPPSASPASIARCSGH